MKKWFLCGLMGCCAMVLQAQYSVRLMVDKVATKSNEDMYVAGSFNNWQPRDEAYKLKPFGTTRRGVVVNVPAGTIAFKFTRGSWDKVEVTGDGRDIANREVKVQGDVVETYQVAGWKDDYPDKPKPNTASAQVKLLDTAFYMPQLGRSRRIWVYLPKGYTSGKAHYPVLYMHDGQNLFNEQTAAFGEWRVDETIDSIVAKGGKAAIVVGIDNGGDKRMTEYNPTTTVSMARVKGKPT